MTEKVYYFRLNEGCGTHDEGDGHGPYKGGDVIKSVHNLARAFGNKFTRVSAASYTEPEVEAVDDEQEPADEPDTPVENPLGTEVTDMFPDAAMLDLVVFKKNKHYNIADAGAATKPLNPAPLTSKEKVNGFLATYK